MITGVWVPLVTPFKDGEVDFASFRKLIKHYIAQGVDGLFPLGTTGEVPTLDDDEFDAVVSETVDVVGGRVPVLIGVGGNATGKAVKTLTRLERFEFDGIVSVCPYYNRPTQDGLKQHFTAIAAATDRQVLVYNIPYRTSVNLANDTLLELAQIPNIVGAKDSSGSIEQSLDLLARRPEGFAVLTGEDQMFFTMMCNGAEGGILASSHIATKRFLEIAKLITINDCHAARATWLELSKIVPLLFQEANPMPIKYCLWKQGLIASPECRLPLTSISKGLASQLDGLLEGLRD
jgi:4-hydroxy-tetrahydrodipicolinate synthase